MGEGSFDSLFHRVTDAVYESVGEQFFGDLVACLAAALEVEIVLVGEIDENGDRVRCVAAWLDGGPAGEISYDLRGSPCEGLLCQRPQVYPSGVAKAFPEDRMLRESGLESYAGAPLIDSSGRTVGLLVIMSRRPLVSSEAIVPLLQALAPRAAAELERTRILRELLAAKREAEDANLAKSRFLAQMSHELRTPLNAVIGFTEMIAQGLAGPSAGDRQREYAMLACDSARHLLTLLDGILNYARLESGEMTVRPEPFDPAEEARDVLDTLRREAERHDVSMEFVDAGESLPRVYADRQHVRQILMNIIMHGLQRASPGGRLTVALAARGEGGVRLAITDDGEAIRPTDLEQAAQPFGRTGRGRNGTGGDALGLALPLSIGLARLNHIDLTIRSEAGEEPGIDIVLPSAPA